MGVAIVAPAQEEEGASTGQAANVEADSPAAENTGSDTETQPEFVIQ